MVTRVLNELVQDGWIVREGSSAKTVCRWKNERSFQPVQWVESRTAGVQIKQAPPEDRPREKLLADGVESLSLSQLLAILIRSGRPGESAVMAGQKLARAFSSRLSDLPDAGREELRSVTSVIGEAAYCSVMAGIELGRRVVSDALEREPAEICSTAAAVEFCRRRFHRLMVEGRQEEFHIVTLDTRNQVIDTHRITVGTLDASLVHPREVFRHAIRDASASVILVHNHPSGNTTPSREDRAVTQRLEQAGDLIGIRVLDHIILGRDHALSLQETA